MKILFNPNLSLSLFSKRTGDVIGTPFKNIVLLLFPSKSLFYSIHFIAKTGFKKIPYSVEVIVAKHWGSPNELISRSFLCYSLFFPIKNDSPSYFDNE